MNLSSVSSHGVKPPKALSIGLIGPGNVGSELLQQIHDQLLPLRIEQNLVLRVCALANSQRMLLADSGVDLLQWSPELKRHGQALNWPEFTRHLLHDEAITVIVDCSASGAVADRYPNWMAQGIHIVTPNKQAGSGCLQRYQQIQNYRRQGVGFHYETTVAAGLPVMGSLRDLRATGDEILAIDGMLSGTLAWLFNRFDGSQPFSELVKKAHAQGYTEPDPRDDLDGKDVARKLVILARECGHALNVDDVLVESLVPGELLGLPLADFWAGIKVWDADMAERYRQAQAKDEVLRYVAKLSAEGTAQVKLCSLPRSHDFARTRGTDNVLQLTSKRYCDNPLVIQGPGAGREVTAAGVFADLLRVAASVPHVAELALLNQARLVSEAGEFSSKSLSVGG
jgi:aspartokinase/homoserine dehydrogenase 1